MLSNKKPPANDAGTHRYNSTKLNCLNSTFLPQNGNINLLKCILFYESNYFSAPIQVMS